MKIYLYRHGQTAQNKARIVQGRGVDSALNNYGAAQAQAFFEAYKAMPFERLLTSTLQRTHQTAAPFEQLGIPTERHESLDEISWGIWEGKAATPEMHHEYLGLLDAWRQGDYHRALPNGDSAFDMQQRLLPFVNYLENQSLEHLLVCTHGGVLGFLMAMLQSQPLSAMPNYKHQNTGLTVFEYNGQGFELLRHNDASHLTKLPQMD